MRKVKKSSDIWVLQPSAQDRQKAARYAAVTLPWTFNRMMKNTKARGQRERALNIAKGIVVQETLARELSTRGIEVGLERKSHRAEDLFDFNIPFRGKEKLFDVKSIAYYSNYSSDVRESFTTDFLVGNRSYSGPDWDHFFPMMVPHTQIRQEKEHYIFAITESQDFRSDCTTGRDEDMICVFPHGEHLPFLTHKALVREREEAGKGFYLCFQHTAEESLFPSSINLTAHFEWDGELSVEPFLLDRCGCSKRIGPMSAFNCLEIDRESLAAIEGNLTCKIENNDFTDDVYSASGQELNVCADDFLIWGKQDFCNLVLPTDFIVNVVGWTDKATFLKNCRKYTAWIWPLDKVDRFKNSVWSQITEKDVKSLTRAGFDDCIDYPNKKIKAGWMKTTGRGPGACCYVFPNMFGGGVKETNLYVLPADLNIMDSLVEAATEI